MRKQFGSSKLCFQAVLVAVCLAFTTVPSGAQNPCSTDVCVLTWQNDTYRTGDNLSESSITSSSIKTNNFGQLCSVGLDGQVYAQLSSSRT
jgi:hypothetical protein